MASEQKVQDCGFGDESVLTMDKVLTQFSKRTVVKVHVIILPSSDF